MMLLAMDFQWQILLLIQAFTPLMCTSIAQSGSTCTYTFHVPRDDGSGCPPGGQPSQDDSQDIASLRELINTHYTALERKLGDISEKLAECTSDKDDDAYVNVNDSAGGSLYFRWGRTTCPDTATLIYDGYTGRSRYNQGGGGNFMCLPRDPEFPDGAAEGYQSQAYIYGTEYRSHDSTILDPDLDKNDMPCAVCEVRGRSLQLMIAAKLTCPSGWTKEYQGLLMAEHHTHRQAEFICVADGMETLHGGSDAKFGGLLYVVEGVCGSLPCPPYVNGLELGCVVCTK